jgi:hypothetical protein
VFHEALLFEPFVLRQVTDDSLKPGRMSFILYAQALELKGGPTMSVRAVGFWGTAHWILDVVGRGTACVLPGNTSQRDDDACGMTGGAILGVIFGAVSGYMISEEAHNINVIVGAALGGLIGASTGIIYGAFVEVVDDWIKTYLNSRN